MLLPEREHRTMLLPERERLAKREYMTVDNAIEHAGFGRAQLKYLAAACIVFFTEVQLAHSGSLVLPSISCEWKLEKWQVLVLLVSGSLAMTISGFIGGTIADKYGRKRNVIYGLFLMILFGGFALVQTDFYLFTAGRAASYFFFMIIKPSALCMALEISPRKTRFFVKMALAVSGQLGAACSALAAMKYLHVIGWRNLTFWLSVPCFIPLIIYCFLEDSPRYLLVSGQTEAGTRVISNIFRENGKENASYLIRNKKDLKRGDVREMFTPEFEKTTWIIMAIIVLKNMVMATLHTALPFILQGDYCADQGSGVGRKEEACHGLSSEHLYSLAKGSLAGVVVICVALGFSQLAGRKISAMCCYFATSCVMLANIWCQGKEALIFKISGVMSLHHAATSIVSLFIQEIYPTSIRALACGFFYSVGHLISTVAPYLTVYVVLGRELHLFLLGGLVFAVCGVLLGRVKHESLNQPLHESCKFYAAECDSDWGLELDYDE